MACSGTDLLYITMLCLHHFRGVVEEPLAIARGSAEHRLRITDIMHVAMSRTVTCLELIRVPVLYEHRDTYNTTRYTIVTGQVSVVVM
jgi:hypothetical protein